MGGGGIFALYSRSKACSETQGPSLPFLSASHLPPFPGSFSPHNRGHSGPLHTVTRRAWLLPRTTLDFSQGFPRKKIALRPARTISPEPEPKSSSPLPCAPPRGWLMEHSGTYRVVVVVVCGRLLNTQTSNPWAVHTPTSNPGRESQRPHSPYRPLFPSLSPGLHMVTLALTLTPKPRR